MAGAVILGGRTAWWVFDNMLEAIGNASMQINWSMLPLRDVLAGVLVTGGLLCLFWPKITSWWKRPSLEMRTYNLAGLTSDTFDKHMIQIASQAGEIAELRSRLEKAGL